MIKHYYQKSDGKYLGQFNSPDAAPKGSVSVITGPSHGLQKREGGKWIDTPEKIKSEAEAELMDSDLAILRTVEDLRDILISKKIISASDFTPIVNAKFDDRKAARERMK